MPDGSPAYLLRIIERRVYCRAIDLQGEHFDAPLRALAARLKLPAHRKLSLEELNTAIAECIDNEVQDPAASSDGPLERAVQSLFVAEADSSVVTPISTLWIELQQLTRSARQLFALKRSGRGELIAEGLSQQQVARFFCSILRSASDDLAPSALERAFLEARLLHKERLRTGRQVRVRSRFALFFSGEWFESVPIDQPHTIWELA